MINGITIEVDPAYSTAYVTLTKGQVARTVALTDSLNLDLDSEGRVLGLELLELTTKMPIDRLIDEYHLNPTLVNQLATQIFA
jgi:uncharacterized protein YuzE